jgi:hypothetical protein
MVTSALLRTEIERWREMYCLSTKGAEQVMVPEQVVADVSPLDWLTCSVGRPVALASVQCWSGRTFRQAAVLACP